VFNLVNFILAFEEFFVVELDFTNVQKYRPFLVELAFLYGISVAESVKKT
jgi:hypothetical protein